VQVIGFAVGTSRTCVHGGGYDNCALVVSLRVFQNVGHAPNYAALRTRAPFKPRKSSFTESTWK
jgi:hypothetical protein